MQRIVVFTGSADYAVRKGIAELAERFPDARFLVMLHKPSKPWRRVARNQWRNLKRNGWRWIGHQTAEVIDLARYSQARKQWHSEAQPGQRYKSDVLFDGDRVTLETTDDIHGTVALARIKAFAPDVGLALAAPILKPRLFEIPRLGTLNLHKGKLPHYRGMPPAFWESLNSEHTVGCTVHRVNKGLDTGDIVLESEIPRQRYSTVGGLRLTLDELGARMMCDAVEMLANGTADVRRQPAGGKSYTKPTLKQQATMARDERRRSTTDPNARRWAKERIAAAYTSAYRPLTRKLKAGTNKRNEVVVLLYHRVNDELRDSVTVGVEQFDAQMAYLAQHYPIASIDDVIHGRLPQTELNRPIVAVPFDDGYYDNYANAVPTLLRHGIPAAFFVSTGMIGKERGFEHDLEKLGHALPNMNWDHLREMRDHGFTIGSHTVTHANCAQLTHDELHRELVDSRDQLKAELGLENIIFAYPFGQRDDLTDDGLDMVKQASYVGCLSAYGGVNRAPVDTFNVLRMGVDFNFSPKRFAARVEGW